MRTFNAFVHGILAVVFVVLVTCGIVGWEPMSLFYRTLGVGVSSFTPTGEVNSSDVAVRITFSGDVTTTAGVSLERCVTLDPYLPGTVRLEDSRTLVFVPSHALAPSTRYTVHLSGSGLSPAHGGIMQGSDSQTFYTPLFKVSNARLFYQQDSLGVSDSRLMAEIDFNYPVDANALQSALSLTKDGQAVAFQLEPSRNRGRFYLKAGLVQPQEKAQTYTLRVAQGLICQGCGIGLGAADTETLQLAPKPDLELQNVQSHPMPGTTWVGLQFSLPVSRPELEAHLRLEPALPINVETEYTYAILKGDFQPNVTYQVVLNPGLRSEDGQELVGGNQRKDGSRAWPITIQDLDSTVRFADKGSILGAKGPLNIAVKTVNLDKFTFTVSKVYRNNLVHFLRGESDTDMGRVIGAKEVAVKGGQINAEVETDLNLASYDQGPYRGLYEVSLSADGAGTGQDWDDDS
ncbi:MAG TPA: Ig-like domain-containing protein, partial [bacterium]|nr:Ig-like domain-containing protein [bacterium]